MRINVNTIIRLNVNNNGLNTINIIDFDIVAFFLLNKPL